MPSRVGRARNGLPPTGGGVARRGETWQTLVEFDLQLNPHADGWASPGNRRLAARLVHVAPGVFDPRALVGDPSGWVGLLVINGLALAQVDAGRAPVGWLVGTDDLVRPWELHEVSLLSNVSWNVLVPMRVALLDADFARRVAGMGPIADALLAKSTQTSHWLFAKSLVTGTSVIEERLLLLFALLGERWGKATSGGVMVAMPLTHQVLATLIGARRPSVSTALSGLVHAGLLERTAEGWLLRRASADAQPRLRCWPHYAEALGLAVS